MSLCAPRFTAVSSMDPSKSQSHTKVQKQFYNFKELTYIIIRQVNNYTTFHAEL